MKRRRAIRVGQLTVRPHIRAGQQSGAWQVDVPASLSSDGKRHRHSFDTRKAAEEYAARLTRQVDVRARVAGDSVAPSGITFAEAAEQWMEEQIAAVKAGLKRRSTLQTNVFQLKPLLAFFAPLDLEEVTRLKVMEYQSQRRERDGLVAQTINSETSRLKQILSWAYEQKLCRSAAKFPSLRVRQTPPELPTLEEIAKIIECLPEQNGLLVRLLIETGCRPGEAYGLNWNDIDFARATIRFRPSEERGLKTPESERTVHISDDLAAELKRFRRGGGGLVFRGRGGGPVTDFGKALNTACEQAPVEDPSASREINLVARLSASGPHASSHRGLFCAPNQSCTYVCGIYLNKPVSFQP